MAVRLIGNSHTVCLLDATTNWRAVTRIDGAEQAGHESAAFAGYSKLILDNPVLPISVREEYDWLAPLTLCLSTGARGRKQLIDRYKSSRGIPMSRPGPMLKRFVSSLEPGDIVISALAGSEHSGEALIAKPRHRPRYDFQSAGYPFSDDPGVQPLDRQFVKAILNTWILPLKRILGWVQLATTGRLLHCLPPPPLKHPERCADKEIFARVIDTYGFLDPVLRIKWYSEYMRLVDATLTDSGVECVHPPQLALDEEGFLKPEFAEGMTHGNREYGVLLATEVSKVLEARSA